MIKVRKENVPVISGGQAAAIIITYKVFTVMTYVPLVAKGYTLPVQLAAEIVSAAAQCLMLVPVVIFFEKYDSRLNVRKEFAAAVYMLYWLYFTVVSAGAVIRFSRLIDMRFGGNILPEPASALMITAVCVYCAVCGIEGIGRSAAVSLVFFFVMAAVIIGGSADDFSSENLVRGFSADKFASGILTEMSRSGEIVMICCLGKFVRRGFTKGVYSAVAVKSLVSAAVTASVMLALGDFAYVGSYPFLDLGSAAGVNFLQRTDALYMVIWVLTAAGGLSAQLYLAGDILSEVFGIKRSSGAVISAVPAAAAAVMMPYVSDETASKAAVLFMPEVSVSAQILLVTVLPLSGILLLKYRRKREKIRKGVKDCYENN